jgi:hypothetical protein
MNKTKEKKHCEFVKEEFRTAGQRRELEEQSDIEEKDEEEEEEEG